MKTLLVVGNMFLLIICLHGTQGAFRVKTICSQVCDYQTKPLVLHCDQGKIINIAYSAIVHNRNIKHKCRKWKYKGNDKRIREAYKLLSGEKFENDGKSDNKNVN